MLQSHLGIVRVKTQNDWADEMLWLRHLAGNKSRPEELKEQEFKARLGYVESSKSVCYRRLCPKQQTKPVHAEASSLCRGVRMGGLKETLQRFKGIIGVDVPKAVLLLIGDSNNTRRPRILFEIQQKQDLDGSCARQEIVARPSMPGPS